MSGSGDDVSTTDTSCGAVLRVEGLLADTVLVGSGLSECEP